MTKSDLKKKKSKFTTQYKEIRNSIADQNRCACHLSNMVLQSRINMHVINWCLCTKRMSLSVKSDACLVWMVVLENKQGTSSDMLIQCIH